MDFLKLKIEFKNCSPYFILVVSHTFFPNPCSKHHKLMSRITVIFVIVYKTHTVNKIVSKLFVTIIYFFVSNWDHILFSYRSPCIKHECKHTIYNLKNICVSNLMQFVKPPGYFVTFPLNWFKQLSVTNN